MRLLFMFRKYTFFNLLSCLRIKFFAQFFFMDDFISFSVKLRTILLIEDNFLSVKRFICKINFFFLLLIDFACELKMFFHEKSIDFFIVCEEYFQSH